MFALKGWFDALAARLKFFPRDPSDKIMQAIGGIFPSHLPMRLKEYRDKYEHYLLLKMSGGFEQANQEFDFAKANLFLAPGAKWIEHSLPEKADELPGWWRKAKAAGVHITFQLHDIDVHVRGDVAWVTLTIDSAFTANNKDGEALLTEQVQGGFANVPANPRELLDTFVESEVLVKTHHRRNTCFLNLTQDR